jgi:Ca-activated chloride channel homolog
MFGGARRMSFKDPLCFILIPVILLFARYIKKNHTSGIRFSNAELLTRQRPGIRIFLADKLIYLWAVALICIVFALARPRVLLEEVISRAEGIDIVLAIDSSTSMLAEDFKIDNRRQSRLFVVKKVVEDFIRNRHSDRIALVTFAGMAYTVCPLTLDYDWLIANLNRIEIGAIEDGTAIGSGCMSALGRLDKSRAKSKIIILLTDGENNSGSISPITAADTAKTFNVKIYAIGVGSKGPVPFPARNIWGQTVYQDVNIGFDEGLLKEMAERTDGQYFIASNTEVLRGVYKHIDELEKTGIEYAGYRRYRELFPVFALTGIGLLILEIILSNTVLRKVP